MSEPITECRDPVYLSFENITIRVADTGKEVLSGVSGMISPGLTAIMGPTASGKTALLNALVQHVAQGLEKVTGKSLINGKEFSVQQVHFGYCLQIDDLNGHLTVFETLKYAADMILSQQNDAQRVARIEHLLSELGLMHVKDVLVGTPQLKGISGGQRKRLSIALAMLNNPPLLILDEPTAGLDSVTAKLLVTTLKHLCDTQRITILCVIHQPQRAIFEMLDRLMLLRCGEIIYDGDAQQCVASFQRLGIPFDGISNPADHIIECISPHLGETVEQLRARCIVRQAYQRPKLDVQEYVPIPLPLSDEMPSLFHQFSVLVRRQLMQELRDVNMHLTNLFVTLACAFLIGGVWFQLGNGSANLSKRLPALFFVCINQSLFGAMKAILHFPDQRRTLMRERRAKLYQTSPAVLAWTVVEYSVIAVWSVVFAIITYFMIGFRQDSAGHFFIYLCVLFLDKVVASSIAMLVCTMTSQPSLPTVILPMVLEISRLFGGFFLPPVQLPTYFEWLDPLSYVKYAYLAVANNELQELTICTPAGVCSVTAANAAISSRKLDYLTAGPCIGVLIAFAVFTRCVAYTFLRFKKL